MARLLIRLVALAACAGAALAADVRAASFLVAVNYTWATCYALGASSSVVAGTPLQNGPVTVVGGCDSGPITFVTSKQGLVVTFKSGVVEDATPPSCTIPYTNASDRSLAYGLPAKFGLPPVLPTCYTMDSREGYHLTQYTFAALAWESA